MCLGKGGRFLGCSDKEASKQKPVLGFQSAPLHLGRTSNDVKTLKEKSRNAKPNKQLLTPNLLQCPVRSETTRTDKHSGPLHRFSDCRLHTLALIHVSGRREPVIFINESHWPCDEADASFSLYNSTDPSASALPLLVSSLEIKVGVVTGSVDVNHAGYVPLFLPEKAACLQPHQIL